MPLPCSQASHHGQGPYWSGRYLHTSYRGSSRPSKKAKSTGKPANPENLCHYLVVRPPTMDKAPTGQGGTYIPLIEVVVDLVKKQNQLVNLQIPKTYATTL